MMGAGERRELETVAASSPSTSSRAVERRVQRPFREKRRSIEETLGLLLCRARCSGKTILGRDDGKGERRETLTFRKGSSCKATLYSIYRSVARESAAGSWSGLGRRGPFSRSVRVQTK